MVNRINQPAPLWFRILNRIWSPTENTVMVVLLLAGYTEESLVMLLVKLTSSYIRQFLDAVLVEIKQESN